MLTKNQIRYLKSQAHHLNPTVSLGNNGLTPAVYKEINLALDSHELIKIKLGALPDDEQDVIIEAISKETQADFVQKIGHIAIFFRTNIDKKKYHLPKE